MSTKTTTYLITGANRGVGRGLADIILSRPNHTLLALVRDPTHPTSQSLLTQAKAANTTVHLTKYDASNPLSAANAIKSLQTAHGITKIDTVIANAASIGTTGDLETLDPSSYINAFTSNTLGPITLFNATLQLLQRSSAPKFIAISSGAGSTAGASAFFAQVMPYGVSKAALNHAICQISKTFTGIAFELLTPGPTRTGFGDGTIDWDTMPGAMSVDEVVGLLMERVDEVSTETELVFRNWKGEVISW